MTARLLEIAGSGAETKDPYQRTKEILENPLIKLGLEEQIQFTLVARWWSNVAGDTSMTRAEFLVRASEVYYGKGPKYSEVNGKTEAPSPEELVAAFDLAVKAGYMTQGKDGHFKPDKEWYF